ncbi:MAG: RidA family protein [Gemmatimonadota bacterium]
MLVANPRGHYHFLRGIEPYSAGAIADPGYEIVHVTLREPVEWRKGFDRIDAHLAQAERDRHALCGVELRSPRPRSMAEFIDFNRSYCRHLDGWDLQVDGLNPVARTNVAPLYSPPETTVLHGFCYTSACGRQADPTLVVAGAGELRDGILTSDGIIRPGEVTAPAMRQKAAYVMRTMEERLHGLGARWDLLNAVNIYTVHPLAEFVEDVVLTRLGPARRLGVRWHHARPPVVDIEFEMDMRGVRQDLFC